MKFNKLLKIINHKLKFGRKKNIFYSVSFLGFVVFVLSGFLTRGYSLYSLFQSNRTDYFMDFFNPLSELFNGPYSHGSIYPPLPLLIYKFLLRFVPYNMVSHGAFAIRASQIGEIVFLSYALITLLTFLVILREVKRGKIMEIYGFIFFILFSAPFLFMFERANIIFIALLFSMVFVFFKDSKNRIIREVALICLAISAGIKLYPALFGLLLLKEKRFKDTFRLLLYGIAAFILPFFAVGGISQLPVLIKDILTTSNGALDWGVGYAVNILSIVRIFYGFIGDFGKSPIFIGNALSYLALLFGVISVFLLKSKWKTAALLSSLIIMVSSVSYVYSLIFMIIPLIMFLDSEEKLNRMDYLYLICFIFIFVPLTLNNIDFINRGFGSSARPLTLNVLIQNIALLTMTVTLILQGFQEGLKGKNAKKN
jgi:hypothetical protein